MAARIMTGNEGRVPQPVWPAGDTGATPHIRRAAALFSWETTARGAGNGIGGRRQSGRALDLC